MILAANMAAFFAPALPAKIIEVVLRFLNYRLIAPGAHDD
jgi:hypothetical protein